MTDNLSACLCQEAPEVFTDSRRQIPEPKSIAHKEQLKMDLIYHIVYQNSHMLWWKSRFGAQYHLYMSRLGGSGQVELPIRAEPSKPSVPAVLPPPPVPDWHLAGKGKAGKGGKKGEGKSQSRWSWW